MLEDLMTYLAFGAAMAVLFVEAWPWIYYAFAFRQGLRGYPFRMQRWDLEYDRSLSG